MIFIISGLCQAVARYYESLLIITNTLLYKNTVT